MENLIKFLRLNIADCNAQLKSNLSDKDRQIIFGQRSAYMEVKAMIELEKRGELAEYNKSYEDTLKSYGVVT